MPRVQGDSLPLGMDHGPPRMRALHGLAPSLHVDTIGFLACGYPTPSHDCGSPPIPQHLPLSRPFQEGKITSSTWPPRDQNFIPSRAGVSLLSFHRWFRKPQPTVSPHQLFSPSGHRVPLTTIRGERKMATGSQRSGRFFQLRELWLYVYHLVSRCFLLFTNQR